VKFDDSEGSDVLTPARVDGYSLHGYESARAAAHVALRAVLRTGTELGVDAPEVHSAWVCKATLGQCCVHGLERVRGSLEKSLVWIKHDGDPGADPQPWSWMNFLAEWCPLEQFTGGEPWGPYAGGDPSAD
jgi:hypothetical protein